MYEIVSWTQHKIVRKPVIDRYAFGHTDFIRSQLLINVISATVCVVCSDGVSQSGLYVAVSCIWERLKDDQEVDVFQTVKHLRYYRRQIIQNLVRASLICEIEDAFISSRFLFHLRPLANSAMSLSVGRLDGKGEDWPPALICRG